LTKIYVIPEGASLGFERFGLEEVPLASADFAVVLLEKCETLEEPAVQEQIKQALAAVKVLGLPVGNCDSRTIDKARSLGITAIATKLRTKYEIMNIIRGFLVE